MKFARVGILLALLCQGSHCFNCTGQSARVIIVLTVAVCQECAGVYSLKTFENCKMFLDQR